MGEATLRWEAGPRLAQPLHNFGPAIHPVHVRRLQRNPLPRILPADRGPILLPAEYIRPSHNPHQVRDLQSPISYLPSSNHRPDRLRVPLRQPKPLRMLIHHEQVAIAIGAAEQENRVVGEPVIQGRKLFPRPVLGCS